MRSQACSASIRPPSTACSASIECGGTRSASMRAVNGRSGDAAMRNGSAAVGVKSGGGGRGLDRLLPRTRLVARDDGRAAADKRQEFHVPSPFYLLLFGAARRSVAAPSMRIV